MKLFDEFKAFALKGSVIDLAVGVVIGAAFGSIVTSLTNDLILPPIGWLVGGMDFSALKVTLPPRILADGTVQLTFISYGKFIQTVINFLIVASAIFAAIKFMNRLRRNEQEKPAEPAAPPVPTNQEKLLSEIRDLLQNKK